MRCGLGGGDNLCDRAFMSSDTLKNYNQIVLDPLERL